MLGLNKLWSAIATLADNLTALSQTVTEVNTGLRTRLQLDTLEPREVLEHQPEPETPPARNGRKARAAAE